MPRSAHYEYFILLNGGIRSSKNISLDGKQFCIFNSVDDTEQLLTEKELFDEGATNIGKAMKVGALWCEEKTEDDNN